MNRLLYSCDPGFSISNATGRAEFVNGELVAAGAMQPKGGTYIERVTEIVGWMQNPERIGSFGTIPDTLVVENPKIYPGPQQKGDPDDVVLLATLVGMIAGRIPHRELLLPRPQEWKGNVPKKAMLERIERPQSALHPNALTPAEMAVLERAKGKRDAVLDAVGLGLWALQRLNVR